MPPPPPASPPPPPPPPSPPPDRGINGFESGVASHRGYLNPGNEAGPTVSAVVTAMGASQPGHTTYQVSVAFDTQYVADVYALYGDAVNRLSIPPAFQVPTPFGTNVGPTNPAFFVVNPTAEFDSFLSKTAMLFSICRAFPLLTGKASLFQPWASTGRR